MKDMYTHTYIYALSRCDTKGIGGRGRLRRGHVQAPREDARHRGLAGAFPEEHAILEALEWRIFGLRARALDRIHFFHLRSTQGAKAEAAMLAEAEAALLGILEHHEHNTAPQ